MTVLSASRALQGSRGHGDAFGDEDAGSILTENERLRRENKKLQRLRSQQSMQFEELRALRSRNAELEGKVGGVGGDGEPTSAPLAVAAVLSPRSSAPPARAHSHIRVWESERQRGGNGTGTGLVRLASLDGAIEAGPGLASSGDGAHETPPKNGVAEDPLVIVAGGSIGSGVAEAPNVAPTSPEVLVLREPAGGSTAETAEGSVLVARPGSRPGQSTWMLRASLLESPDFDRGGPEEAWTLCTEVRLMLARGDEEAAKGAFARAFAAHVEGTTTPHLGFSSIIPALFVDLRHKGDLEVSAACRVGDAESRADAASERAFEQCARLVRHLIQNSSLGESPPQRRPAGVARRRFVRDLCSHVGLSLDLARLGFAQRLLRAEARRQRKPTRAASQVDIGVACSQGDAGSEVGERQPPRTPSQRPRSRSRSRRGRGQETGATSAGYCVDKEELSATLKRAGTYLSAALMDMTRLHDDSLKQLSRGTMSAAPTLGDSDAASAHVSAGVEAQQTPSASLPLLDEGASCDAEPTDSLVATQMSTPEVPTAPHVQGQGTLADVSDPLLIPGRHPDLAASAASRVPVPGEEADALDPLLVPTVGEFLEKQLLPLYMSDVPFKNLRYLCDHYCGTPLDSDDEAAAWKTLGRSASGMSQLQSQRPIVRRGTSDAGSGHSVASSERLRASASTSLAGRGLSELCRAGRLSTEAPMRPQMLTSVAEKRRKGQAAPGFMDLKGSRASTSGGGGRTSSGRTSSGRTSVASSVASSAFTIPELPGTPTFTSLARSASALLQSPTPLSLEGLSACSPVSTRAARRGLDTTLARTRLRPAWELLGETPQRP